MSQQNNDNQVVNRESNFDIPILTDESQIVRCPYCGLKSYTTLEFTNGYLSYIIVLLVFLTFGVFLSLLLIPMAFILTKQLIHKCSSCDQQIGTNGRLFNGFEIKDDIISIKIGEIGFILTKKIFFSIILTVLALIVLYIKIQNLPHNYYAHSHDNEIIRPISTNWETFLQKCAYINIVRDHQLAHKCMNEYLDKTVISWTGYVIRVEDYRESMYRFLHHAVQILVKMEPSEAENHPDILLTFDSELADRYADALNNIERGKQIQFNATIKSLGNDLQTRHFHVRQFGVLENSIDITPLIHYGGRYADTPKQLRKEISNSNIEQEKEQQIDTQQEQN